jgi:hypothetical protein
MGAVQAQDFESALWALGLRSGNTAAEVRKAIALGLIIRTWPNRGTLHFVAREDARWMMELMAPRSVARSQRRHQQLGLDSSTIRKAEKVAIQELSGNRQLTREDLFQRFERKGVSTTGQRGYHLAWLLGQRGVLCFGAPTGKHQTFALLEDWVPPTPSLPREEALVRLASRYFASHGPATLGDFAWWAGLTIAEARQGAEEASSIESESAIRCETIDERTYWSAATGELELRRPDAAIHLLPPFDEYLLGYKERAAMLTPEHAKRVAPGANGIFLPIFVAKGHVEGTWKREIAGDSVTVRFLPFQEGRRFSAAEARSLRTTANRFALFLGLSLAKASSESIAS